MNKTDLANALSEKMDITQQESLRFIGSLMEVIGEELGNDGMIALQGFGSLVLWKQKERPGRNPQNGAPCTIRQRMSVKFRPGKFLLESINRQK